MCKHYKNCGHDLCPVDDEMADIYCDEWEPIPEKVIHPCCESGQVIGFNGRLHCVRCKREV